MSGSLQCVGRQDLLDGWNFNLMVFCWNMANNNIMTQIFYYALAGTFQTKESLTGTHHFGYSLFQKNKRYRNERDINIDFFYYIEISHYICRH